MSSANQGDLGRIPAAWSADDHQAAMRAYISTVDLLPEDWPRPGNAPARQFFEAAFAWSQAPRSALLTGYYEPELFGSEHRTHRFGYPVYAMPEGVGAVGPCFDRATIETTDLLAGHELVWLETALDAFLAQVQGSLRVRLPNGLVRRFGYAGRNGHPYRSIGQTLIARGAVAAADMSVDAIRAWADRHPDDLPELLRTNPSFVFFRPMTLPPDAGPLGSMGRSLTDLRSIAVDPDFITLGAPVWVEMPGVARLMIAQDTGSAIKGPDRADIFFGVGDQAGRGAGALKAQGRLIPLLPRSVH